MADTAINAGAIAGADLDLLVAEFEVSGGAVTSFTISGLDLNDDGGIYYIDGNIANALASPAWGLLMKVNGKDTNGDYRYSKAYRLGSAIAHEMASAAQVAVAHDNLDLLFNLTLVISKGTSKAHANSQYGSEQARHGNVVWHREATTETNITSIKFESTVASAIDNGSKLTIQRKAQ